ncbi:MAG TPA: NADPH-dependent F420 reductase [Candidatus Binatus sp.]|nr:NADPH-dependent F420 reductase [Candidatus Binatus sp.]
MNIAIVGAGSVGKGLAGPLVKAGHRVHLTARDLEGAREAARETGAVASPDLRTAIESADVVILAIPFGAVESVSRDIAGLVDGKVVVDVSNPAKADWSGPLFGGASSAAEQIAAWLPGARVVKAFNTIFAANLGTGGRIHGQPLDAYMAGDDGAAKALVAELAMALGFTPVDVGPITAARLLESLAWLNISLNVQGGNWQSGWKLLGLAA